MKSLSLLILLLLCSSAPLCAEDRVFKYSSFGNVHSYVPDSIEMVVVLFSDTAGWTGQMTSMALKLKEDGALVLGIDTGLYLKKIQSGAAACAYLAGDIENLSHHAEQIYKLPDYQLPVLAGYAAGSAIAAAAIAQSPKSTFAGAAVLGFCPGLSPNIKLCPGDGLQLVKNQPNTAEIDPASKFGSRLVILQGQIDKVCNPKRGAEFARSNASIQLVPLDRVGHGFTRSADWFSQFQSVIEELSHSSQVMQQSQSPLENLPLVELPVENDSDFFVLMLTGDGGWAGLDQEVGEAFNAAKIPVVGWNTLHYFWHERQQPEMQADLAQVLKYYLNAWHKQRIILMGYSLGADVIPFMASGLPPELFKSIALYVLLAPGRTATFEFHFTDWFGSGDEAGGRKILPEVQKLQGRKILCIGGEEERDDLLCSELAPALAKTVWFAGSHHFDKQYAKIVSLVLSELPNR